MTNIQTLVPEGSLIKFNPLILKDWEYYLCMYDKAKDTIVYFEHNNETVYKDVWVECTVTGYTPNDDKTIFITLTPVEKPDSLLYILMSSLHRGDLSFLQLL